MHILVWPRAFKVSGSDKLAAKGKNAGVDVVVGGNRVQKSRGAPHGEEFSLAGRFEGLEWGKYRGLPNLEGTVNPGYWGKMPRGKLRGGPMKYWAVPRNWGGQPKMGGGEPTRQRGCPRNGNSPMGGAPPTGRNVITPSPGKNAMGVWTRTY